MSQSFNLDLLEVVFKNFMSYGNIPTVIDLSQPGTIHIMGENLDKGGSSGSGKSTLVAVVSYCIYDKIPSKVSKDKLINSHNDKKSTVMEASTKFRKGSTEYLVKRWRGASTGVQLFENGVDITPDSVGNVNAKIEEIFGISYQLFSLIVLFSGNNDLFLDSGVGAQRGIMEELFKITTLSLKANALKKVISETDKSIALQKQAIKHQEQQKEQRKKHLSDAELRVSNWVIKHNADLDKVVGDIARIASIDFDSEEQLHKTIAQYEDEVKDVTAEITILTNGKTAKGREKSPVVTELALLSSKIVKDNQQQKKLLQEHNHLADNKCPYCLQKFEAALAKLEEIIQTTTALSVSLTDDEAKEAELKTSVDTFNRELASEIAVFDTAIAEKRQALSEIQANIAEFKSVLTFKTFKEHTDASKILGTLQSKYDSLCAETNPHVDALDSLKAEGEVVVDTKVLDELVLLAEHQAFLLKLLTDKNSFIRKNIISKTIPFLNKRIGYYTQKLNMPHMVLFQPDMTCEISQMGRSLDHGNLSNGEKKQLNLALCLAFRDVLTYFHSKINVLFTDEVDGGSISGVDVDALIGLLKHKAWDDQIGIYIISHRPEFEGRCDRTMIVRKEGGFSTLLAQPED